jgi:hypothetical protein
MKDKNSRYDEVHGRLGSGGVEGGLFPGSEILRPCTRNASREKPYCSFYEIKAVLSRKSALNNL